MLITNYKLHLCKIKIDYININNNLKYCFKPYFLVVTVIYCVRLALINLLYTLTGHFIMYTGSIAKVIQIAKQPITWQQYLSIVIDHVHHFMTTVYPSSDVLPAG